MNTVDKTLNQEIASLEDTKDWQTRVIVAGGIVGAVLGVLTSYLLVRTSNETRSGPPAISTGDVIKVSVTTIGLVRAIAALGDRRS